MTKQFDIKNLKARAEDVSALLKELSHPNRLLIACALTDGERSVSGLADEIGAAQPHISRDLARLRDAGLLISRREAKNVYYSLADKRLSKLIYALCDAFSPTRKSGKRPRKK